MRKFHFKAPRGTVQPMNDKQRMCLNLLASLDNLVTVKDFLQTVEAFEIGSIMGKVILAEFVLKGYIKRIAYPDNPKAFMQEGDAIKISFAGIQKVEVLNAKRGNCFKKDPNLKLVGLIGSSNGGRVQGKFSSACDGVKHDYFFDVPSVPEENLCITKVTDHRNVVHYALEAHYKDEKTGAKINLFQQTMKVKAEDDDLNYAFSHGQIHLFYLH